MADNTTLPSGTGGDTVRTIDRATAKTQVVQLDFGGEAGPESLATSGNPLPIQAASLPLPSGAATAALQNTMQATLATLTNLLDTQGQIIKLLSAILVTLGNNGGGYVDPEEAAQLTTLQ